MEFEIDVSGSDLLSKNYTICIADKEKTIKGFKFENNLINILCSKYGQGLYKYEKSKKSKSTFKVRLYSIVIYFLFKSLKLKKELNLTICRDFTGRENDIKENLKFFLEKKLNLKINQINFTRLDRNSQAHKYSYLMRHDTKNKMQTYIKLNIDNFERWLLK